MKLQKTSLIYIINANKGIETIVNCLLKCAAPLLNYIARQQFDNFIRNS